ncbi:hypothetical protein FA95DRAFT_1561638 [Auriscalpium vulgare]|uniref:Uncharacterized protein n=1 Tax=Auriscalpium vulgare TaxID=40419 RepID=A0ACB8RM10_9AGAM|nr:hypothetical protein FA95DRAFT_1561638 [Auriscalpium vulgare]
MSTGVDRSRLLDRYIVSATRSLDEVDSFISRSVGGKPRDLARKILTASNSIMPMIENIASLHPISAMVVSMFKAITRLECERRDNDDRIAVTHHTMALSVSSLKLLSHVVKSDPILERLQSPLRELQNLMKEFGNFASLYYVQKQRFLNGLFRSNDYRRRLEGFTSNFQKYKGEIESLVGYQTALNVHNIEVNVQKILRTMGRSNSKEVDAAKMVERLGGTEAVLLDEKKLAHVAAQLHERLSEDMSVALRQPLEVLLHDNESQFGKKLDGAVILIQDTVEKQKDAIIDFMKMGPHELVKDEDFKAVWSDMKFKTSVQTPALVDAIYDQFKIKFRDYHRNDGRLHPDQWTLSILSKAIYHGPIGDAIDEDSSGYISVYEVNRFLDRRPAGWSVPEWLSFWARGWTETNNEYREMIKERLAEIEDTIQEVEKESDGGMQRMLGVVRDFCTSLTNYEDENPSVAATLFDDEEDYPEQLARLRIEYRQDEQKRLEEKLREPTVVNDTASLIHVLGHPRIELSIMPLVSVWLSNLLNLLIEDEDDPDFEDDLDYRLEQLLETMLAILWVFNKRMNELTQVWRQQRMNVTLQIQCFCGGIFSAWYNESIKPDNILKKLATIIDGNDASYGEDADPPVRSQKLKGDMDQKLQLVWNHVNDRMDSLDTRLGAIETMLRKLLEAPVSRGQVETRDSGYFSGSSSSRAVPQIHVVEERASRSPRPRWVDNSAPYESNLVSRPESGGHGTRAYTPSPSGRKYQ